MVFAADYPFLDVFWTMLVFFAWVIWFWLLITVFAVGMVVGAPSMIWMFFIMAYWQWRASAAIAP